MNPLIHRPGTGLVIQKQKSSHDMARAISAQALEPGGDRAAGGVAATRIGCVFRRALQVRPAVPSIERVQFYVNL